MKTIEIEFDDTMSSTTTAITLATKHYIFNKRLLIKMLVDDANELSWERATETLITIKSSNV